MILFISFEFAPPQGFLGLAEFFLSDFVHDGKKISIFVGE